MYGKQGSGSATHIRQVSSEAFLEAISVVSCILAFWILPSFLNSASTIFTYRTIDWGSVNWLRGISVALAEPNRDVLIKKCSRVSKITKSQKDRRYTAKSFSKLKELGKVARVDQLRLTQAISSQRANSKIVGEVEISERKKLVDMHHLLTLRALIALNATPTLPPSPDVHLNSINERRSHQEIYSRAREYQSHQVRSPSRGLAAISKPVIEETDRNIDETVSQSLEWQQRLPVAYQEITQEMPYLAVPEDEKRVDLLNFQGQIDKLSFKWSQEVMMKNRLNSAPLEELEEDVKKFSEQERPLMEGDFAQLESQLIQSQAEIGKINLGITQSQIIALGGTITDPVQMAYVSQNEADHLASQDQAVHEYSSSPSNLNLDIHGASAALKSEDEYSKTTQMPIDVPKYVEAFDPKGRQVIGVQSRMISSENFSTPLKRGWHLAEEGVLHWSTLSWFDPANNGPETIPLMNKNALAIIENEGHVGAQVEHAGFIFGKIARGWQIRLAGRAERVVYLDSENLRVLDDSQGDSGIEKERYFALLNVEPGSHLLYAASKWGEGEGTLAIPVLERTATYLDLTQISHRTLKGEVFEDQEGERENEDGSAEKVLSIELVGQPSIRASLNVQENPEFEIPNVITFGNYPFYIWVRTPGSSNEIHQYRILPKDMGNYPIYLLSTHRVETWLDQIPDGDQNIVEVGVPDLVKNQSEKQLIPGFEFVSHSAQVPISGHVLQPWAWTDSPLDRVSNGKRLHGNRTRFIGVNVPRGLILPSIRDQSNQLIWSELTMTWTESGEQPARVVNIVGPY